MLTIGELLSLLHDHDPDAVLVASDGLATFSALESPQSASGWALAAHPATPVVVLYTGPTVNLTKDPTAPVVLELTTWQATYLARTPEPGAPAEAVAVAEVAQEALLAVGAKDEVAP